LSFRNNITINSLYITNGKVIIDNYRIYVIGSYQETNPFVIAAHAHYDMGLSLMIIGCGMIFIGLIVKWYQKIKNG
jgi:hypothetical protein